MKVTERFMFRAFDQGKNFGKNHFYKPISVSAVYDHSASSPMSYLGMYVNYRFKTEGTNQFLFAPAIF